MRISETVVPTQTTQIELAHVLVPTLARQAASAARCPT
jgi:hypothetical protein